MAHRILIEYEVRAKTNTLTIMKIDKKRGASIPIYDDYIGCLQKYHIPFFDRTFITSIDAEKLYEFDIWRAEKLERKPARSTLMIHNAALKDIGLDKSPYGKRTLYSLQHSFITWELVSQKVTIDVLACQCGTSIEMIERHYRYVIPTMFSQQLSGVIPKKEKIERKWKYDEKINKL